MVAHSAILLMTDLLSDTDRAEVEERPSFRPHTLITLTHPHTAHLPKPLVQQCQSLMTLVTDHLTATTTTIIPRSVLTISPFHAPSAIELSYPRGQDSMSLM